MTMLFPWNNIIKKKYKLWSLSLSGFVFIAILNNLGRQGSNICFGILGGGGKLASGQYLVKLEYKTAAVPSSLSKLQVTRLLPKLVYNIGMCLDINQQKNQQFIVII